MIKRGLMIFSFFVLAASSVAHAGHSKATTMAPDRVGRYDWGVGLASSSADESDTALFVSTAVSYGVTPYIGVGVEGGWQESDTSNGVDTIGVVPILADIIIRVPTVHETIVPYGILGLGGAGVYIERDNRDDVDDIGFAWKIGAGADWFINSSWLFNFEFAYWDASVDLPGTDVQDGFDFWTIGVGLKYLF